MARPTTISFEEASKYLSFNPESGEFTWKAVPRGGKGVIGQRAGFFHKTSGYRRIAVCGCVLYEHRLAMIFATGQDTELCIDHMNGIKHDNRISNLKIVDHAENNQNKPITIRTTKLQGVVPVGEAGWQARIIRKGVVIHAGVFKTDVDAHEAYKELRRALHYSFR